MAVVNRIKAGYKETKKAVPGQLKQNKKNQNRIKKMQEDAKCMVTMKIESEKLFRKRKINIPCNWPEEPII